MIKTIRTALVGLGNVNRSLLQILVDKQEYIATRYHLHFVVQAVADSSGVAISASGFEPGTLISHKLSGKKINTLQEYIPNSVAEKIAEYINVDLVVEASPVNLKTGSPGLDVVRSVMAASCNVVMANKGPLVLAFDELMGLAKMHNSKIAYSATVCGGLPVINLLTRDLKATQLLSLEGIFNATSNFVLQELAKGNTMKAAVAEAQRIGAAETDPSLDLSGQDTANKLYIIMKSFSDFKGSIHDIQLRGIDAITREHLQEAAKKNTTIKLVASAVQDKSGWNLSVAPRAIPEGSFIGNIHGWEMGIEIKTDLYESISMKNYEADPTGTAAAVMRDMIEVSMPI